MSVALTFPILIGLFLLGMERLGNDGDEADVDRQGSDRRIEGRGAWTHR
jgi:hypothetical protein